MELEATATYQRLGLDHAGIERLSALGDLVLASPINVTGVKNEKGVEEHHFLDSLSLLALEEVAQAESIVDVGSGGGFPALVLAIALPEATVVALESTRKKCDFIRMAKERLGLRHLEVAAQRAEDFGRGEGSDRFDVAVTRAVGALAVEAELALPLLKMGGSFVAMKGALYEEERGLGERALAILGAEELAVRRVVPFPGAENRSLVTARKVRPTPDRYPRRPGIPAKRPLGAS